MPAGWKSCVKRSTNVEGLSLDAAQSRPFEGLYGFIRHHLTMVNAVVLFASTLVAAIDFLSPKDRKSVV